ncbi:MAG: CbtA family protein [Gaiellaceae bacterium]
MSEPESRSWPGASWLRVALVAGVAAGLVAAAFNLGVGERVVDEAIALEPGHHGAVADDGGHTHVTAVAEPFTRGEQKGGMIIGQGVLGLAVGLLIAGAALMVGKTRLTPQRFWLALVGAGLWALLILPAVKFPPLPPGVETALEVERRQVFYLLLVLAGLAGVLLASAVWTRLTGERERRVGRLGPRAVRAIAAAIALVVPAAAAFVLLPGDEIVTAVDGGLLARFRIVSIASQALFWVALAGFGLWLLEHRRLPFLARRRAADA